MFENATGNELISSQTSQKMGNKKQPLKVYRKLYSKRITHLELMFVIYTAWKRQQTIVFYFFQRK